jgi:hypothetical protein
MVNFCGIHLYRARVRTTTQAPLHANHVPLELRCGNARRVRTTTQAPLPYCMPIMFPSRRPWSYHFHHHFLVTNNTTNTKTNTVSVSIMVNFFGIHLYLQGRKQLCQLWRILACSTHLLSMASWLLEV